MEATYTVKVSHTPEECPDLSYLGEFTSKPTGTYFVDRNIGALVGPWQEKDLSFEDYASMDKWIEENEVDSVEVENYEEQNDGTWSLWYNEQVILDDSLSTKERNEHAYYQPEVKIDPSDPDSIKYAARDYERRVDYGNGWGMLVLHIEISSDGDVVAESYLSDIESDSSDDYIATLEKEQITEAFAKLLS